MSIVAHCHSVSMIGEVPLMGTAPASFVLPATEKAPANATAKATEKAVVLLIEHNPEDTATVAKLLASAGYISHCCRDAQAALDSSRENPPNLIIADANLAGASGLRLCELIKQQPRMADVPLMFLSANQVPDIIRRSHQGGCAYHVRKPFDPQVLLELIDKALWAPRTTTGAVAS